jgi:hypothetical protein
LRYDGGWEMRLARLVCLLAAGACLAAAGRRRLKMKSR